MPIMKYLLPAFAVVGAATAASSSSCAGTTTLQNGGDAAGISSCTTFSGDIVVATQAANTINIDGIKEITGSLTSENAAALSGLEASSLQTIGNEFTLTNLTVLSSLNFPQLSEVKSIQWTALPALQTLMFTNQVQKASNVLITDTQLSSLEGINLQMVDMFNINNNRFLKSIEVQLGNITQSLNIEANGEDLNASFPNLEWAYNMTFRNCSSVKTPSLATINGSLGFYDNFFTEYTAPNLTSVGSSGGSLSFVSNDALTNISLPLVTTIGGGYQIANNTKLHKINGFEKLKVIKGGLDFNGNFSSVALPALADVRGGFNMQSSAPLDCSPFQKDKSNSVIKGTFQCAGTQKKPGGKGTKATGTGVVTAGGSSATSTGSAKKSAAGRFDVNVAAVLGLSSVVAALLHLSF